MSYLDLELINEEMDLDCFDRELSMNQLIDIFGGNDSEEDGVDPIPKEVQKANKRFCDHYKNDPKMAEWISILSNTQNPCKTKNSDGYVPLKTP